MNILTITLAFFLILELANIITLYFWPGSQRANGVGVFKAWEKSKSDPEIHQVMAYLVNWVAGSKLIFVALLLIILTTAGETTQRWTAVALILSILSYFWRLDPLAQQMDQVGQLTPSGYGRTLRWLILAFIGIIAIGLILSMTNG